MQTAVIMTHFITLSHHLSDVFGKWIGEAGETVLSFSGLTEQSTGVRRTFLILSFWFRSTTTVSFVRENFDISVVKHVFITY